MNTKVMNKQIYVWKRDLSGENFQYEQDIGNIINDEKNEIT